MRSKKVINKAMSAATKAERRHRKKAKARSDRLEFAELPKPTQENAAQAHTLKCHDLTNFAKGDKLLMESADRRDEFSRTSRHRSRSVDIITSCFEIVTCPRRARRNTGDAWDTLTQQDRRKVFENTENESPMARSAQIWAYMYTFDVKATDSAAVIQDHGSDIPSSEDAAIECEVLIPDFVPKDSDTTSAPIDIIFVPELVRHQRRSTGDLLHFSEPISADCAFIESLCEASAIGTPEDPPFLKIDEETEIDEAAARALNFIEGLDEDCPAIETLGALSKVSECCESIEMAKPVKKCQRSFAATMFKNQLEDRPKRSRRKTVEACHTLPPCIKASDFTDLVATRSINICYLLEEFAETVLFYSQDDKDFEVESAIDSFPARKEQLDELVEKSKSLTDVKDLAEPSTSLQECEMQHSVDSVPEDPAAEDTFAVAKDHLIIDTQLNICSNTPSPDLVSSPSETVVGLGEGSLSSSLSPRTWSLEAVESFLRLKQHAKPIATTVEPATSPNSGFSITLEDLMQSQSPTGSVSPTHTLMNVPTSLLPAPLLLKVEDLLRGTATPESTYPTVSSPIASHQDHSS
ncbi:hypothetical protein HDU97_001793 [Phlyctochytrium planicorne]|nr:hypothetical protein HDU97_001793 [Phlyctochytrium planicorne]